MPKAVCLLSGGLDSATCLAIAQHDGFDVHALSFDYGQRHTWELTAAKRIAERAKVSQHIISKIDLTIFGHSALTSSEIAVPKSRDVEQMSHDIPVTYVPARNTIFLSFALAFAEVISSTDIFIGVNALDYSGYPDCRPEYIHAYEHMANLATKSATQNHHHLKIHTPLIHLTKAQIIHRGITLGVDYSLTSTCYDPSPNGLACGQCDACILRLKGFAENNIQDPAPYQAPD